MSFPRMKPYMLEDLTQIYDTFGTHSFTRKILMKQMPIENATYARMIHRDYIIRCKEKQDNIYCLSARTIRCILDKRKREMKPA
jgi:hypothetical protein